VPVIVVGNLTVGGTGKTPLVIWLAEHLRGKGWRPGIVARGYGGRARHWPQQVRGDSDPAVVGDEAVLLAQRSGCPVCVAPDRPAAVAALLQHTDCNLVLSDDGLQHYALGRDIEIVVIDGQRRFGNGFLLPAGPLREPLSRLRRADLVVVNGEARDGELAMRMRRPQVVPLRRPQAVDGIDRFDGAQVHAVAGVGNPRRFFDLLRRHGLQPLEHAFPDHHVFTPGDIRFADGLPVLMTEKDAVKCQRFAGEGYWAVRVEAQPDASFVHQLNERLNALTDDLIGDLTSDSPGE
jgi:tetraacyldisaccharide 4'-kinase